MRLYQYHLYQAPQNRNDQVFCLLSCVFKISCPTCFQPSSQLIRDNSTKVSVTLKRKRLAYLGNPKWKCTVTGDLGGNTLHNLVLHFQKIVTLYQNCSLFIHSHI